MQHQREEVLRGEAFAREEDWTFKRCARSYLTAPGRNQVVSCCFQSQVAGALYQARTRRENGGSLLSFSLSLSLSLSLARARASTYIKRTLARELARERVSWLWLRFRESAACRTQRGPHDWGRPRMPEIEWNKDETENPDCDTQNCACVYSLPLPGQLHNCRVVFIKLVINQTRDNLMRQRYEIGIAHARIYLRFDFHA